MKRTIPQIIMLNHASWVNSKRMGLDDNKTDSGGSPDDPVVHHGKKLSELSSTDMMAYYADWGA